VLRAYDPRRQLDRGWTLTSDASGRLVRSTAALTVGARITTRFVDGEARSVVESTTPGKPAPKTRKRTGGDER